MVFRRFSPWLAFAVSGFASAAFAQALVCPTPAAIGTHACEVFHFHQAMYRPETRGFAELYGINQFASQSACERAREAAVKRNLAVVERMRIKDQQYEPDRFGQCHCDMTIDRASPNYLNDMQRVAQLRLAEEIRLRVREKLLDNDVPSDAEVVRGLIPPPSNTPLIGGPKLAPLPTAAPVAAVANAAADLKITKTIDTSTPATSSLDLPLVEVPTAGAPPEASGTQINVTAPAPAVPPATQPAQLAQAAPTPVITAPQPVAPPAVVPVTPQPAVATSAPAPAPAPATPALPETKVAETPQPQPPPPPAAETIAEAPQPADETAESFVAYETERIQNVLKASSAIGDDAIKSQIFKACMERIQLLSNLRSLIQGSGARSRLATATRNAKTEEERLALVASLFGSEMPPHWAPQDAKDVVLDDRGEIDADSEKVLRDTGTRYSTAQKKRALYQLLAHSQPTEEQQLWLGSVIDGFLQ